MSAMRDACQDDDGDDGREGPRARREFEAEIRVSVHGPPRRLGKIQRVVLLTLLDAGGRERGSPRGVARSRVLPRTGTSRASMNRAIRDLTCRGFVQTAGKGRVRLTPAGQALARALGAALDALVAEYAPFLATRLARANGESGDRAAVQGEARLPAAAERRPGVTTAATATATVTVKCDLCGDPIVAFAPAAAADLLAEIEDGDRVHVCMGCQRDCTALVAAACENVLERVF